MRMQVPALLPHLGPLLEGVLLWSEDSKNKFRLKVRWVVLGLACMHFKTKHKASELCSLPGKSRGWS